MSREKIHSLSDLTPQAHPLPPPSTCTSRFNTFLRVKTPSGPLQSLLDTTQAAQKGYKQPPLPLLPPLPSPLQIT